MGLIIALHGDQIQSVFYLKNTSTPDYVIYFFNAIEKRTRNDPFSFISIISESHQNNHR